MYNIRSSNLFHFLSILSLLFGSLLLSGLLEAVRLTGLPGSNLLADYSAQIFLVLGPVLIYFLVRKGFLKNALFLKNPGAVNIFLAILLTFVLIPTVGLLNVLSMFFVENHIGEVLKDFFNRPYAPALVAVAVFPGIFEELSARFILLNNYRHKPYYIGCLMSGLFFGMIHLNVNQFIYALVLGALFAFLVQITESIYTSIAMHITLNATTFSVGYFQPAEMSSEAAAVDLNSVLSLLGVNIITIPIAILIILFLIKYNGKMGILKLKPTALELTLGRKIPEYDAAPQEDDYSLWQNRDALPDPRNYIDPRFKNDYPQNDASPFNWSFWAAAIVFLAFVFLLEIAPKLIA